MWTRKSRSIGIQVVLKSAIEKVATYHYANEIQFRQLVVPPFLCQTVPSFLGISIEQGKDRIVSRGRLKKGRHS